ncbi:hypothetical protein [Ferruginibacter profundus]
MEFYNFADANYLLAYYTDKLIGKPISHKTEAVITHLEIDDWANGNYRLMAKCSLKTERDVCEVAKYHDIVYPSHVLKERPRVL